MSSSCRARWRIRGRPTLSLIGVRWATGWEPKLRRSGPRRPFKQQTAGQGLETRAVRIRPDVVLRCQPENLNIVLERIPLAEADRFDLMVGTNIFIYYDAFERSLALENAGAMLKHGGLLLTNDRLPEVRGGVDAPGRIDRRAIQSRRSGLVPKTVTRGNH